MSNDASNNVENQRALEEQKTVQGQERPRRTNKSKGIPRGRTKRTQFTTSTDTGVTSLVIVSKGKTILFPVDGRWMQYASLLTWTAHRNKRKNGERIYAVTYIRRAGKPVKTLGLHGFIYMLKNGPLSPGLVIDHIDRDTQNTRESNLRALPPQFNSWNSEKVLNGMSKFPCVTWHKHSQKWRAMTTINKKQTVLGGFDSEEEAAKAVLAAVMEVYPEIDWVTFQPEIYPAILREQQD